MDPLAPGLFGIKVGGRSAQACNHMPADLDQVNPSCLGLHPLAQAAGCQAPPSSMTNAAHPNAGVARVKAAAESIPPDPHPQTPSPVAGMGGSHAPLRTPPRPSPVRAVNPLPVIVTPVSPRPQGTEVAWSRDCAGVQTPSGPLFGSADESSPSRLDLPPGSNYSPLSRLSTVSTCSTVSDGTSSPPPLHLLQTPEHGLRRRKHERGRRVSGSPQTPSSTFGTQSPQPDHSARLQELKAELQHLHQQLLSLRQQREALESLRCPSTRNSSKARRHQHGSAAHWGSVLRQFVWAAVGGKWAYCQRWEVALVCTIMVLLASLGVLLMVMATRALSYQIGLDRTGSVAMEQRCTLADRPFHANLTWGRSCARNAELGYWTGDDCAQCLRGWRGPRCLHPCVDAAHCSGHGTCVDGGGCVCFFDWEGATCSVQPADRVLRAHIKAAYMHSWESYVRDAFGHDVLQPLSRGYHNWIPGGMGLTLIDAMDGLWMLGEYEEFAKAKEWVKTRLSFDVDSQVSVFEVTIRVLGGLLAAYTFDKDWGLIEKAVDLADRLLPSFQSPSGIPYTHVNLRTGHAQNNDWSPHNAILAEFGTLQMEFRYLSHLTGNRTYDDHVTRVMRVVEQQMPPDGLFPLYYNNEVGTWGPDHISFGALGDSFYEYLLKQYLQTGRTEPRYLRMYRATLKGLTTQLLVQTPKHTYIAERQVTLHHKMDHLACFVPGMLALGADGDRKLFELAESLTHTCVQMYAGTITGISPESTIFENGTMRPATKYYILRPEVIESLFYMWRFTKNPIYRRWGWQIFKNINRHCRIPTGGFSGIQDVTQVPTTKNDRMASFWLAETLKYLHLLFSDDSALDLEQFVLNTEGHPFPVIPPLRYEGDPVTFA
mmetsp:Transcript_80888/g.142619  ORF Transcript_80888/g.142619 Transcript_80888/m.142619 type:complete len:881 (-) Transcript_80888:124-2766(-)